MSDKVTFENWFVDLQACAVRLSGATDKCLFTMDREAYREFYDEDYTPEAAWMEECSNG